MTNLAKDGKGEKVTFPGRNAKNPKSSSFAGGGASSPQSSHQKEQALRVGGTADKGPVSNGWRNDSFGRLRAQAIRDYRSRSALAKFLARALSTLYASREGSRTISSIGLGDYGGPIRFGATDRIWNWQGYDDFDGRGGCYK